MLAHRYYTDICSIGIIWGIWGAIRGLIIAYISYKGQRVFIGLYCCIITQFLMLIMYSYTVYALILHNIPIVLNQNRARF